MASLRFKQIVQKIRVFVYEGGSDGLGRMSVACIESRQVDLGRVW